MRLRDIQQKLLVQLFTPSQDARDAEMIIANSGYMHASERINIYRDSIFAGLTRAMAETYPVCKQLVGEPFFDVMAGKYIVAQPSLSPDLNEYGGSFAEFIQQYEPARAVVYLADMARLEWLMNQAFTAGEVGENNLSCLQEMSDQALLDVVFHLPPHADLLRSIYPLDQIWSMHQGGNDTGMGELQPLTDELKLVVWRPHRQVQFEPLQDEMYLFLSVIKQGMPFAQVCEHLLAGYPNTDIGMLLATAMQRGWLQDFS
jgi:hypothetical protein